ncbi:MAG: ribonuclease H-like domain-containing protein [Candidatus Doudnabacteria bacterium]|nr:ribonuclease H-like domain-containing protein [Candidatus Doudnabacteria bacterium]
MLKKIVLDLETQKSFDDVGGRGKNHLLKISVCGIYDYTTDKYSIYREHEIPKLGSLLQTADQIIGYNIKDFDFEVLRPYLNFNIDTVPYLDLLEEIAKAIGHRIKLEDVAQATLGKGKSGSGKDALLYFKQGRWDTLEKYCLDDVKVTKQVYDYVFKTGKLLYKDFFKVKEIPLKVSEPLQRQGVKHQAALF